MGAELDEPEILREVDSAEGAADDVLLWPVDSADAEDDPEVDTLTDAWPTELTEDEDDRAVVEVEEFAGAPEDDSELDETAIDTEAEPDVVEAAPDAEVEDRETDIELFDPVGDAEMDVADADIEDVRDALAETELDKLMLVTLAEGEVLPDMDVDEDALFVEVGPAVIVALPIKVVVALRPDEVGAGVTVALKKVVVTLPVIVCVALGAAVELKVGNTVGRAVVMDPVSVVLVMVVLVTVTLVLVVLLMVVFVTVVALPTVSLGSNETAFRGTYLAVGLVR